MVRETNSQRKELKQKTIAEATEFVTFANSWKV